MRLSTVVLDRTLVELFKENTVLPSLLYMRNLVCLLLAHLGGVNAERNLHQFKGVRLHKESKSVTGYVFTCQLGASNYTVRSSLQTASSKDLS